MNVITATITGVSFLVVERNDLGLVCQTFATEGRPATFAEADKALAFYSFRRTSAWELDENGGVSATVAPVDNRFNGTVAARLDEAVGTTHEEFELALATTVDNGDLVTDAEFSAIYVVAGFNRVGLHQAKLHMVGEGKTWEDRHSAEFTLVQVARRKR